MMSELRWGGRRSRVASLGWAYALGVVACSGKVADEAPSQNGEDLRGVEGPRPGSKQAALRSGNSCDRLLQRFQADLLDQVKQRADQARQGSGYSGPPIPIDGGPVPLQPAPAQSSPAPVSAGESPSAAPGVATSGGFSDTTVQVPGVDEADFVKAEGDRIYLLHGATLYVLGASSANSTEILGSVPIEGDATELFAYQGKVVVFSRFYGALPGLDQSSYAYYYNYYPSFTKLTVIDVASSVPQVERESYVEGSYLSSRRHAGVVRAILQQGSKAELDYPNVSYVDFLGHARSQGDIDRQVDLWVSLASETIADSVIEDYLPSEFERMNGSFVKQPLRCGDYWLPQPGLTQAGASSVVTLDLDQLEDPLRQTTVLGYADRVYANDAALLITQTDYRYYTGAQTSLQTNIHRFDLDGPSTSYAASGTFSGSVQSQFSLDELDGVIRVSTTESPDRGIIVPLAESGGAGGGSAGTGTTGPVSRILTLGKQGNQLVELGRTPDFGESEQIYATRFLGDRGYVVTFRQIDPLFVVDLADPSAPKLAGQLQLQGYSNFLYPLPDHRLLAVGQDADAHGVVQGFALQIFDVRDANAPSLSYKYTYAQAGSSDANYDHRAISFHPDQNLVAFPFQSYVTGQSTLEVFRVSGSDGLTRLGGVQPPPRDISLEECLPLIGYPPDYLKVIQDNPEQYSYVFDECRGFGQPTLRRGLFKGDAVYAVSTLNVAAFGLDHLDGPPLSKADLPLAYPSYYYPPPYYGGGAADAGAAGSFGMAGGAGAAGSFGMAGSAGAAGSAMMGFGGAPFE